MRTTKYVCILLVANILGCVDLDFVTLMDHVDPSKVQVQVVSWDLPGYGRSRPPVRHFSYDTYHREAECCLVDGGKLRLIESNILTL
jgi:hypothetical protein